MGDGAESVNLATGMTPSWLERGRLFLMNREWPHLLLVFTATFAVYCWSMPRTVVFEDDGLFIMASYFNGIAHPPGYPLFTLLGHLATFLPVCSGP
ncbi:MAG: DUF2723 domain-containing protein [Gammaproteobacteria bacterium]